MYSDRYGVTFIDGMYHVVLERVYDDGTTRVLDWDVYQTSSYNEACHEQDRLNATFE